MNIHQKKVHIVNFLFLVKLFLMLDFKIYIIYIQIIYIQKKFLIQKIMLLLLYQDIELNFRLLYIIKKKNKKNSNI